MDAFLHGTEVKLTVPLMDESGNQLNMTAVDYIVLDQFGNEVVPRTPVAGFVANSATVTVTVPAASNALSAGQVRAVRSVVLFCTTANNVVMLSAFYSIKQPDVLVVGVNSFQGYSMAQMIALDMPNIAGWDSASDAQRTAALIDAREHICQLSFERLNRRFGQDSLQYLPEGTRDVGTNLFGFAGDLKELTPDQFKRLPADFLSALSKAQVAEANVILGGDPVEAKRTDGLLMDSVGESRQMFRPGKPLQLPVSRRALAYLSQFVTFSKQIGRA